MKPLQKLTGTDRQADRQTDGQDHVLSQADALTKKSVCLFVCLSSGLFFKVSNWMIYWLLTVVLAPYLSD